MSEVSLGRRLVSLVEGHTGDVVRVAEWVVDPGFPDVYGVRATVGRVESSSVVDVVVRLAERPAVEDVRFFSWPPSARGVPVDVAGRYLV